MSSFILDMSHLGVLQSVTAGQRDRNARVLAVVHAPVPCKEELLVNSKTTAVPITILKVLSAGFSCSPFVGAKPGQKAPPVKEGETPEPMFELVNDTETNEPPNLKLWSYVSKGTHISRSQPLNLKHSNHHFCTILNSKPKILFPQE
jgi:hypothetical protein